MTSGDTPIRGKVARILNSRELAINVGSDDGVTVGMRFDVLDRRGDEIKDPDTSEVLGSVSRPKVQVEVSTVQPRFSLARTFRTRRTNVGGTGTAFDMGLGPISRSLLPPRWVQAPETLKTSERTWEDLDESKSFVKIGDPVVQVRHTAEGEAEAEAELPSEDPLG